MIYALERILIYIEIMDALHGIFLVTIVRMDGTLLRMPMLLKHITYITIGFLMVPITTRRAGRLFYRRTIDYPLIYPSTI